MEKLNLPRMKRKTAEVFSFYQIPKVLFRHEEFSELDGWSILLFSMLVDRVALSSENAEDFTDKNGDIFIIFTVEEAMKKSGKGNKAIIKYFKQLEDVGLIERIKRGQGKPSIIYVNDFTFIEDENEHFKKCQNNTSRNVITTRQEVSKRHFKKCNNHTSRSVKNTPQEVSKGHANKTDINKTDLNETESINPINQFSELRAKTDMNETIDNYDKYREIIHENIEYAYFMTAPQWESKKQRVSELAEIIIECVCSSAESIRVGKQNIPKEIIKSRMLKLGSGHIEYILDCLDENKTSVKNIKEYLKTAIYNAPVTIDSHYSAKVNHDYYNRE